MRGSFIESFLIYFLENLREPWPPLGPLGPSVCYGPAKFGARFNRQLSSIPHVCVRSLHVPSPLRFFKAHSKKFDCFFVCNRRNVIQYQTWTNSGAVLHSSMSTTDNTKQYHGEVVLSGELG